MNSALKVKNVGEVRCVRNLIPTKSHYNYQQMFVVHLYRGFYIENCPLTRDFKLPRYALVLHPLQHCMVIFIPNILEV